MSADYVIAPSGWTPESTNPFSPDGEYGPSWSAFEIRDAPGDQMWNGTSKRGLYGAVVSNGVRDHAQRLADFIAYENAQGRKVIVSCPAGTDGPAFVQGALAHALGSGSIRPHDPRWVVHSTTAEAWRRIQDTGELRASGRARVEGGQPRAADIVRFKEPPDYADYVMFGPMDAVGAELVMASRTAGKMALDENAPYAPGVRLYLDAHRIITDGLAVRDGLHVLKARRRLPLSPYLAAAVGAKEADPLGELVKWTPRLFLTRSNEYFLRLIAGRSQ